MCLDALQVLYVAKPLGGNALHIGLGCEEGMKVGASKCSEKQKESQRRSMVNLKDRRLTFQRQRVHVDAQSWVPRTGLEKTLIMCNISDLV